MIRYVLFLAVLANLLAYPSILGLLPVVAKVVYGVDENGLAQLLAALASGALLASTVVALARLRPPATVMAVGLAAWLGLVAVFAFTDSHASGMAVLFVIGFAQSLAMIAMGAVLLMVTAPAYRGRVMGVRMLAVYGMPLGLLVGGAPHRMGGGPLPDRGVRGRRAGAPRPRRRRDPRALARGGRDPGGGRLAPACSGASDRMSPDHPGASGLA